MNRRGMTLVEVVLSITIAAIVMAMLFAALRLGQKSSVKGERRLGQSQRELVVADRISWLLAGTYPLIMAPEKDELKVLIFRGQSDTVEFATTSVDVYSNTATDLPGLKTVRIFLDDEGLKVGERKFFMPGDDFDDYVLDPDARGLEFEFMDIDEDTGESNWVAGWEGGDKKYLPAAVKMRVMLDEQQWMPEIIVKIPTGGPTGVAIPLLRLP